MFLYRIDDFCFKFNDIFDIEIVPDKFNILSDTPKGFWIDVNANFQIGLCRSNKKWVSNSSKKRYAYPTKLEALNGYLKRKESHIKHLQDKIRMIKDNISIADKLKTTWETEVKNGHTS